MGRGEKLVSYYLPGNRSAHPPSHRERGTILHEASHLRPPPLSPLLGSGWVGEQLVVAVGWVNEQCEVITWVNKCKYKYWIDQGTSNIFVFCADDAIRWSLYLCTDSFSPSRCALWPWLSLQGPAWDWWLYIRDVYQLNFSPVSLVCDPQAPDLEWR